MTKEPQGPLDVYAPIAEALHATMKAKFDDKLQRDKVARALVLWLVDTAKKRPLPDLAQRITDWSKRIEMMVEHMKLDFSEGKIVIKVNGSDEQTLKALQFGSLWFEANDDLMETIMVGLFET